MQSESANYGVTKRKNQGFDLSILMVQALFFLLQNIRKQKQRFVLCFFSSYI
jgi:hypothetical protein